MTAIPGTRLAPFAGLRLAVARLRHEWPAVAMVFGLIAVTAFLFAAAPRAFYRIADDGLRHELREASTAERNLEFARFSHIAAGAHEGGAEVADDPVSLMQAEADQVRAGLPDTVRGLIGAQSFLIDTVPYLVRDAPNPPSYLSLRYQSEIDPQIRLVEGRLPGGSAERVTVPGAFGSGQSGPTVVVPGAPSTQESSALLVEVALSASTLEALGVSIGERLYLAPNPDLAQQSFAFAASQEYLAVDVAGSFEILEPDAEYWLADTALQQPTRVLESVDLRITYATVLMSPEAIAPLSELLMPLTQEWRFQVDPDRVDAGELDQLVADMRLLESTHPALPASISSEEAMSLQTGLSGVLRGYLDMRMASEAALVVAAIGPAAAAAGAIALSAALLARRRRTSLALVRGRGASLVQLLLGHATEAVAVAAAASALGLAVATLVVPSRPSASSIGAAVLVAAGSAILLIATSLRLSRSAPSGREDAVVVGVQPRRLVLEAVVVILAIAGVLAIRDRGLLSAGASAEPVLSPYLAAVPLLLGVAVGLVVLRLYPLPVRGVAWLAALGRGVVTVLALRRAGRQSAWAQIPVLVLLVSVAIGSFSSITLASVERGQDEAAWQRVGAEYRVTSADALPESLTGGGLDAPTALAFSSQVPLTGGTAQRRPTVIHALEVDGYAHLLDGTPAYPRLLRALDVPAVDDAFGSDEQPLPAIVSDTLAGLSGLREEDTFELSFGGRGVTFTILDVRGRFPGLPPGSIFVVTDLAALRAAAPDRDFAPTALFVGGGPSVEDALREAGANAPGIALESRADRLAELRNAPLVAAIGIGFATAVAVAVAYAALALVTALVLTAAARGREVAMLRTMGLGRGQQLALAAIEYLPPLLVAVTAGGLLGIAIASLLQPGLELDRFVGAEGAVRPRVDLLSLALVGALPAAVLGAALLVATVVARQASVSRTLRAMEE